MMHMVLDPDYYGKIRTYLDKVTVPGVGAADEVSSYIFQQMLRRSLSVDGANCSSQ